MGEINLPESEKNALKGIDERELRKLIEQAVQEENLGDLYRLPLSSCGACVARELHRFGEALKRYRESKSARKREETHYSAMRAGDDLSFAVTAMKRRIETDEREGQLFHVDDNLLWPNTFSRNMQVRVSYRWRKSVDDDWKSGSITFHHEAKPRPIYQPSTAKKKPSAAKQAQELQKELSGVWEHFMRQSLYSVRDFFREGGDGSEIPGKFQAMPDSYDGRLNNFSTIFWKRKPESPA